VERKWARQYPQARADVSWQHQCMVMSSHHRLHGGTLYTSGHRDNTDAAQAAQALIPLAGKGAGVLFALGYSMRALRASILRSPGACDLRGAGL